MGYTGHSQSIHDVACDVAEDASGSAAELAWPGVVEVLRALEPEEVKALGFMGVSGTPLQARIGRAA
jgi:hypothetical protein